VAEQVPAPESSHFISGQFVACAEQAAKTVVVNNITNEKAVLKIPNVPSSHLMFLFLDIESS